tara:strand:- start:5554 stop:5757 length:204 start_codon:yes stop_codon:yes gene_type:complete
MKGNNMNTDKYAKLNNEVDSLIAETNKKMHELIENYNEENEEDSYVDTVDLNSKFDDLADYIEEYSH